MFILYIQDIFENFLQVSQAIWNLQRNFAPENEGNIVEKEVKFRYERGGASSIVSKECVFVGGRR